MKTADFAWQMYQRVGLPAAHAVARWVARFNPKWRQAISGAEAALGRLSTSDSPTVWIHAASAGELEQARPILRAIRTARPRLRLVVTCFSPAGVEMASKCEEVDQAIPLPLESVENARLFLDALRPKLCLIVGADLWPSYALEASRREIPFALVNAFLRPKARRLWPGVRMLLADLYRRASVICCRTEQDREAMDRHLGVRHAKACGNTRFDQVEERARRAGRLWEGGRPVWVLGSTWPGDESVFLSAAGREPEAGRRLWVVVPHEPGRNRRVGRLFDFLRGLHRKPVAYSEIRGNAGPGGLRIGEADTLVVDRTGVLMDLYRMAEVACVGGAFGPGVHSVLEPAAFGLPILFGPKHGNSEEAVELRRRGAAAAIRSRQEVAEALSRLFHDAQQKARAGAAGRAYIQENLGATQRILACLEPLLPSP